MYPHSAGGSLRHSTCVAAVHQSFTSTSTVATYCTILEAFARIFVDAMFKRCCIICFPSVSVLQNNCRIRIQSPYYYLSLPRYKILRFNFLLPHQFVFVCRGLSLLVNDCSLRSQLIKIQYLATELITQTDSFSVFRL